jgi:hypothetical protein
MIKREMPLTNGLYFAAEYPLSVHDIVKSLTDYDFLIALTAMRDPRYRDLFRRDRDPRRYRIVDSGIFEDPSNPITPQKQLAIALELDADEVVPIDAINDCDQTLKLMREFLGLAETFPFKVQGVVQGKSLKEWLRCFWELHDNPRVDVIGLTYFEVPRDLREAGMSDFGVPDMTEVARLTLLNLVMGGLGVKPTFDEQGVVVDSHVTGWELEYKGPVTKPIHLLGCRHCRALRHYAAYPLVRSIDTSFPVQLGVEGRPLHLDSPKSEFKVNFGADLVRAERCLIGMNTLRFLTLCRGKDDSPLWEVTDRIAQI